MSQTTQPLSRKQLLRRIVALLTVSLVASIAYAQAQAVVVVRAFDGRPADAEVTLTPDGEGAPRSCRTTSGTCRIADLPGGRYVVSARPRGDGRAPIARPVLVPPSGEVTISVTLQR